MRDVIEKINEWKSQGKQIALATVVKVYGSAPRPLGGKMAVCLSGEITGSVSGGCVEGAVFEEAQECMDKNRPKLVAYGISNENAWSVGLACGGQIEVFVEPYTTQSEPGVQDGSSPFDWVAENIQKGRYCAQATLLNGTGIGKKLILYPDGHTQGDLGDLQLNRAVADEIKTHWTKQQPFRFKVEKAGFEQDIFVDLFPPKDKLIIIGAVHIAIPLVQFAKALGFYCLVIDARRAFATRERFPDVDELIVGWPGEILENMNLDESTYIVVVSHDEKIDNPALKIGLSSKVRYIGALGSKQTHIKRLQTLVELGIDEGLLKNIYAPIGLPIGAVGAEEIALSIMAEIICVRRGLK